MKLDDVIRYLKEYSGPELRIMEVCGTHTAAIFKTGVRSLLPPAIRLISGPGCPVCVTPTSYIDKCIEYALMPNHAVLSFGDMMKVPGENGSLSSVKGEGGRVELMYSPMEAIKKAKGEPATTFVIAAVGFETTVPAYGLLLKEAKQEGISNIRLLTSLKTIVPALTWLCEDHHHIDGFLCPGHVSVINGMEDYNSLADRYRKPFVIAGFDGDHILTSVYAIVRQLETGRAFAENLYPSVVRETGNEKARALIADCFETGNATWRGLGAIDDSGYYIKDEYKEYDAGSRGLNKDKALAKTCKCAEVITGAIMPNECPMFAVHCTPENPHGPCMVSAEGACGIWYQNQ